LRIIGSSCHRHNEFATSSGSRGDHVFWRSSREKREERNLARITQDRHRKSRCVRH